jgi:MFS family permease
VPTAHRTAIRKLAVARAVSLAGSEAAAIALTYTVYHRTGSSAWVAATWLLTFGALGFMSPVAGLIADRFDRQRVMVASDLAGAACFAVLAVLASGPPWLLLLFAFLSAAAKSAFFPAQDAAIPNLVGDTDRLTWANGTISVGRNAGIILGPILGGLLVAWGGARAVFVVNAVSFTSSALLVRGIRGSFHGDRSDAGEHRGVRAGFAFLASDRMLRGITISWTVLVLGLGAVLVAEVQLAASFGSSALWYGLIATGWGVGELTGSLVARRAVSSRTEGWALIGGAMAMAAGIGWISVTPWFGLVVAGMVVGGVGDAFAEISAQGMFQRRTPDSVRSRVMAASDTLVLVGLAASFLFAGPLVDALGARGVYAVAGSGCAISALILLPILRGERPGRRRFEPGQEATRRLESVPHVEGLVAGDTA